MQQGDEILIVEGDRIKLIGHIALKLENADLSRELWKPLRGNIGATWELIYFIANPRELDVPFVEFNRLFEYADEFRLRGLTAIAEDRLDRFYARYDDLYSVLVSIKSGEPVATEAYTDCYSSDGATGAAGSGVGTRRCRRADCYARGVGSREDAMEAGATGAKGRRANLDSNGRPDPPAKALRFRSV